MAVLLGLAAVAATANADTLRNGDSIYGKPADSRQANRVVDIATVKRLVVACGEIVTFQNGGKQFSWKFDTISHRTVDVQDIAPKDFGGKPLEVYVHPNEFERS